MSFELPTLPLPKDANNVPYVLSPDANGNRTVPASQWFKDASNLWLPVSAADPLPVRIGDGTDQVGVESDGSLPVKLTGSYATMRTPVTGVKTVTATVAEIFAGASRLAGRRKMILKNEDATLRFRIGSSSVTQQNGFPIEPGAAIELDFDPAVDVPIYAISEGANLNVAVMEI